VTTEGRAELLGAALLAAADELEAACDANVPMTDRREREAERRMVRLVRAHAARLAEAEAQAAKDRAAVEAVEEVRRAWKDEGERWPQYRLSYSYAAAVLDAAVAAADAGEQP
jgi:hypothetical protein